jgi:hypothetical protein
MNNVSFTSRLNFVDSGSFNKIINSIGAKNTVNFPWTVKESVLADKAVTTNIFDCVAFGLTDGSQVLLMHICPTVERNKSFAKIEKFILNKINIFNENLQGFILGGKYHNLNSPNSIKMFDKFEKFLEKYNIPYSKFKGGPFKNDVAYITSKDEWIISNDVITPDLKNLPAESVLHKIFDDIKISKTDELVWT